MSRRPIVAANWKMFKTVAEARRFVADLQATLNGPSPCEAVICPPFTALVAVVEAVQGSELRVGAQNMYHAPEGAFTGEVSPVMLTELGVHYVILGHSERRRLFAETDALIREKVQAAFQHGLTPILCVGETLEERDRGETEAVIDRQVQEALAGRTRGRAVETVIAYEPVWAIGSGRPCDPAEANRVAGFTRQVLARLLDAEAAAQVRIQYGGSVKPDNIAAYLEQPEIDGALVGGASLDPRSFARMVGEV